MCTYLDQVGSTYYFRRVVPLELRPFIRTSTGAPRAEWKRSLKTKDRDEAKRLIPRHTLDTQAEIDAAEQARRVAANSPDDDARRRVAERLEEQAKVWTAALVERSEADAQTASEDIARREAEYERRAPIRERFERAFRKSTLERSDEESAVLDIIRDLRLDFTIERERETMRALTRAEARRGIASPPVETASLKPASPATGVPLLASFDSYAAEQGMKPGTRYEWRRSLAALVDFLGHDDAARITVDDLDRWVAALLAETTKRGQPRSPRTVRNNYVSPLRASLNWLIEKRKLTENVAAQITIRVPRKAMLRERDFTPAEAKAILSATLKRPARSVAAKTLLARRWIPWLCAYTGARVNEISQLRGQDVTQIDGIWTIRITPEAGTVKANAARIVPLHPHLIEQGFPAVAQAAGDAPIFYDPSRTRRPGIGNRHFKKVGERLRDWVRDEIGITDSGLQPNHAWRHTFKTMTRAADIPERVADAIQGHAPRSVGQSYGSVPLQTLADAIGKIPRFELEDRD
ncbi:hypothetical protein NYR55_11380 [Sphingomonas sp. BGYR3]|uniref:DUF6538 domain-containing protein n=1 Tax=Sphingomonas sp. BGYR3 TaxID=2975483 RepID=UPI0021A44FAB|nr:DUF6538 domain-containing protein [Sphingomonas sp. BGYR3]MDG5489215.1 hypothetical protein [Sphingomonas sp. BGYR3]